MPGLFERIVYFMFGPPPEDEVTKILMGAASRENLERDYERVGVFVLPDGGEELSAFSPQATAEAAAAAIESLNWEGGINFVVAVPRPGVALEVSGCLDPEDGLSLSYYDRTSSLECVSEVPPASLAEAKSVLSAFLRGESSWQAHFKELA